MASLDLSLNAAIRKTKVERLDILTCGALPPNPSEILASETMKDVLALLKEKYEFVVIDAPPVIAVTDAAVLAPQVDGALLVIESARNDRDIILKAKGLLDRVNVNLVGAVLNNVRAKNLYGDYDYYTQEKEKKKELLIAAKKNQEQKIKQAQIFINRFRASNTRGRSVQSRIKALNKMEKIEIPGQKKKIRFQFPQPPHSAPGPLARGHNLLLHDAEPGPTQPQLARSRTQRLTRDHGPPADRAGHRQPRGHGRILPSA